MFKSLYEKIHPEHSSFDLNQVFLWMCQNQARHDEHKVMMRAYQGLDQLVDEFAKKQIETGNKPPLSIQNTLFKTMNLSIWDMYEIDAKEEDTEVVLRAYVSSLCKQYSIEPADFSRTLDRNIKRIINETKQLIPKLQQPHGSELRSEVVHEHQQEQQQKTEQQQQQTLLTKLNENTNITLTLETYDEKDELDAIFNNRHPSYSPFSLPECKPFNLPKLLLNPRHFTHIKQSSYNSLESMKPIDTLIIQRSATGQYQYLACSPTGAKIFREQLLKRKLDANSPSYMMVDSLGTVLFKSSNCNSTMVKDCQNSESFNDMMCYMELLKGQIMHPEKISAFIKKQGIDKSAYYTLVSKIKALHVSPTPIELEDLPYFENLCGWRDLDERIKVRLAAASEPIAPLVEVKASAKQKGILPERAKVGFIPDVMPSILPPIVLGLETTVPHLIYKPEDEVLQKQKSQSEKASKPVTLSSDAFIKAIQLGIDNFITYHQDSKNNPDKARGTRGFFTSFRHRKSEISIANTLKKTIHEDNMISKLDDFFNDPKTTYHRHSLASYLLDELLKTLNYHDDNSLFKKSNIYDEVKAWSNVKVTMSEHFVNSNDNAPGVKK